MSLLSSLFGKKRRPCEKMIVELLDTGNMAHFMNGSARDRNGAKFESALVTALILLQFAEPNHKNQYKLIEKYTFDYLFELANKYGVKSRINMNLSEFMNLRFEQNGKELDTLIETTGNTLPTKMLYNFFDTPLKSQSGSMFIDPMSYMAFLKEFMGFYGIIKKSTPLIAEAADLEPYL